MCTSSSFWNAPEKYGPHSELFFFVLMKEPVALTKAVPFKPVFCADTLKACSLIGLHLLAEAGEAGSSGCQSPDLRDMWRHGCPKSPEWDSEGESWSESLSSSDFREHNVESLCDKVSFFSEDWELARAGLSCPVALDMFSQEMHEAWSLGCRCQRGALTVKERDVVRYI